MKEMFTHFAAASMIMLFGLQNTIGQDARSILARIDEVTFAPKDQKSVIKIILTDAAGKERRRKATILQKGPEKRLIRFTEPASQAGIGFLSLPDEIMYIYLPAYGKERRIATHVKNQNFAGTDFSYDDMEATPYSEKYDPVLLDIEVDGYVLELKPRPTIRSDYQKLILFVNKSEYYVKKIEFFNRAGELVKVMNNKVEKKQGYWVSIEIEMKDLRSNHTTKMVVENASFDNNLSDDEFTIRKLKQ